MEALEMERRMDNLNDARLDELNRRVNDGFERVDRRFEQVEEEMKEGFAKAATKVEVGEVKVELRHLNDKFDRLMHAMTWGGISLGITVLATLVGTVWA
jgi:hypothetical protein